MKIQMRAWLGVTITCVLIEFAGLGAVRAEPTEPQTPETVIRQAVLANERRDLEGMAQLFLKDADVESFGIAGLKFVGWNDLEQVLRAEFQSVSQLEIEIKDLKVWRKASHGLPWNWITYGFSPRIVRRLV